MKNRYYPDLEGFKQLATKGNIIPVYRQLFADTLTPVSAFQKISDVDFAFCLKVQQVEKRFPGIQFLVLTLLLSLPLLAIVLK